MLHNLHILLVVFDRLCLAPKYPLVLAVLHLLDRLLSICDCDHCRVIGATLRSIWGIRGPEICSNKIITWYSTVQK